MDKCKGGRGPEGKPASCIWFTRPFLFCPPLVLNLKTWLPGVPPLLPPPPSPLKSLCYVHSCTVHITSAAPSYSPTTAPPCRPAIAEHVPPPPPPRSNSYFHFRRVRAQTHKQGHAHQLVGTCLFSPLRSLFLISFNFFPFSSP